MPHVELSLSGEREPGRHPGTPGTSSMWWWANAVAGAAEPCVVLDADGVIVAHSETFRALLGAAPEAVGNEPGQDEQWVGRGLLEVITLVDLTATATPLAGWETERVPPLLVLATGNLARGVMRVRVGSATRTVDAVSTPLWDEGILAGSLTFVHRIS